MKDNTILIIRAILTVNSILCNSKVISSKKFQIKNLYRTDNQLFKMMEKFTIIKKEQEIQFMVFLF